MTYMYPHPRFSPDLPKITSAKGIFLFDETGKSYIDSTCGPMTTSLGHCHPRLIDRMKAQIGKLHFAYRYHFRSDEAEALAAKLIEISADNKAYAFFLNSGSEASESAYRFALQYQEACGRPGKTIAVGRKITNHGNTIQSLTYGDDVGRKSALLDKVIDCSLSEMKLPPCYCFQCPFGREPSSCHLECVDRSMDVLDEIGSDRIACLFAEPVTASSGGALVPHPGYMRKMKEGLSRRNILLIADEVVTGIGRTGTWFNMPQWGVQSDITVVGKSLGAGLSPISGVLLSSEIGEAIKSSELPHTVGHTYSGNPLSCSVALSVIEVIESEIGLEEIVRKGNYLGQLLTENFLDTGIAVDVRGRGLLWAIETDLDVADASRFVKIGHRFGVNLYPCRSSGKGGKALTFLLSPAFIIARTELEDMAVAIRRTMETAAA